MAFIYADRVQDTSITSGTGALTVSGGAPSGKQTFSAVCSVNDTFYYSIEDPVSGAWETGEGTYSALNTVARTTVRASSNSNAAVNFASNIKNVFLTPIAYFFQQAASSQIGDIKWSHAPLNSTNWKTLSPPAAALSQATYPDLYALLGQKYLDFAAPSVPTANAGTDSLAAVIWNGTLSKFIAVGGTAATSGRVITSPDGTTWTSRDTSGSARWASVACSGTLAIAVTNVTAGTTLKSTDGITWSAGTAVAWAGTHALSGTSAGLFYSAVAGMFIAASNATGSVAGEIKTTTDCVTWTSRTTPWTSGSECASVLVNQFAEGNGIIVLMSNTAGVYATSTDGINWTRRTAALQGSARVLFFNGLFIANATANGTFATSPDGINWTVGKPGQTNAGVNSPLPMVVVGSNMILSISSWDFSTSTTATLITSSDLASFAATANFESSTAKPTGALPTASDGATIVWIPSVSATSSQIATMATAYNTSTHFGLPTVREIGVPAYMRAL